MRRLSSPDERGSAIAAPRLRSSRTAIIPFPRCVSGVNCFTCAAQLALHIIVLGTPQAPPDNKARHKTFEFHQVHDAQERTAPAHDQLWVGGDDVCPLQRNRADGRLVELLQESLAVSVVPLADADELLSAERVERMRYAHKVRRSSRRVCNLN